MASSGGETTLSDLSDDTLSCVLSFLRPEEVRACAGVCKRLREMCRQKGAVWRAICQRRWGSLTSPSVWGHGRIPFTLLYVTLDRWEHLIGFWRGVGNGFLALFDWGLDCIVGYKVVPASINSYAVCKLPFLWMTLSEEGQVTCLLDPAFKTMRSSHCRPQLSSAVHKNTTKLVSPNAINANLNTMLALGMVLVDVHFVGYHHLVIEEVVKKSGCISNELAEFATLAAFGSNHNLLDRSPPARRTHQQSNDQSDHSSSSDTESRIGSPGSFQHEMYHFLTSKVISAGGERAARKQRMNKERGLSAGRSVLDPEHFVKVINSSPTKARPLQGLWKGFFERVGLDFVLVSYDDKNGIVCRKVQDLDGTSKGGYVLWTSESVTKAAIPFCVSEEALYSTRTHSRPGGLVAQSHGAHELPFDSCSEVVCTICTSSCDVQSMFDSRYREGRVWQYANGTFGFGYCHSNLVVDFRALCSDGFLLDSVD